MLLLGSIPLIAPESPVAVTETRVDYAATTEDFRREVMKFVEKGKGLPWTLLLVLISALEEASGRRGSGGVAL
ncbi:MAG: hypothetical protein V2G41_09930 [bacterium JZ-2024 1]